ncbi:hypothetical protein V496_02436 [Pseudogymnoascus sp. VKM F-4515 (FW-2607)]|nr:hypothetical protein V496_02436 [Pseudogymnoascus sp. VKM F-4515 (FW-2607)]
MDDSTQHQHYGYHQNIMQANQQIGQQPQTFNPMEHFWFANLSPSSEEEQQSQMGDESLSFSSAGTLLPSPAQSLSSSSAFSSAGTLLPSPADLDIGTSATSLLQTVYQLNRNLNQQLQGLNQKVEEVKTGQLNEMMIRLDEAQKKRCWSIKKSRNHLPTKANASTLFEHYSAYSPSPGPPHQCESNVEA